MKSMKIAAIFGICLVYSITGSNALFDDMFKLIPNVREILQTIAIPATRSPPRKPFFPRIIKKTTTTTPATTTPHPDDVTIGLCNEAMDECPWTSAELVEKIIERQNVNTTIEFTGKGKSVGPAVDPSKVGNELKKPSVEKGTGSEKRIPGLRPRGDKNGVPHICLPFGQKKRNPVSYYINCINYLSDVTIPRYNNRRNAMLGCFKCRYLCELGGAISYI